MNCLTCDVQLKNKVCLACNDIFISCNCTTNICSECRSTIYSDPAKHRFGIAWFGLIDCFDHMYDEDLSEAEQHARECLIDLVNRVKS